MPSKRLYSALALAVAVLGIAVVFRPTAHAASAELRAQGRLEFCYHVDASEYVCPDSLMTMRYPVPDNALNIQSASVTVTYKDRRTSTSQLPATTDAVFLSKRSLRTFLLLHYLATDDKKFSDLLAYINTGHAVNLPAQQRLAAYCYHVDASEYVCPDSLTSLRYPVPANALDIVSVSVTVTYKGGRTATSQLPATTDAVFLSKKSLRAFLLLHYLATDDKKFNDLLAYINKAPTSRPPVKTP